MAKVVDPQTFEVRDARRRDEEPSAPRLTKRTAIGRGEDQRNVILALAQLGESARLRLDGTKAKGGVGREVFDMRLSWRDGVATICVGAAVVLYAVWLSKDEVLGVSSARGIGFIVLVLGLAASVTAVVLGVGEGLPHASQADPTPAGPGDRGARVGALLARAQIGFRTP